MKKMLVPFLVFLIVCITIPAITYAIDAHSAPVNKISIVYENGEYYKGDFINGMFHGKGVYVWANGERYEGDFFFNRRTGKGVYFWPSGERYEGEFADGKLEGWGIYTWPDGAF